MKSNCCKSSVEGYWKTISFWKRQCCEGFFQLMFAAYIKNSVVHLYVFRFMSLSTGMIFQSPWPPSSKSYPAPTALMAALSFALIHQRAHELEKGQTRLKEERVWPNSALLNLWSRLNSKPNSCIAPLFAGGSDPLLSVRRRGGMFSPNGVFSVQVGPMRANICSAEESLSKTLHPDQLRARMAGCAAEPLRPIREIDTVSKYSLLFMEVY